VVVDHPPHPGARRAGRHDVDARRDDLRLGGVRVDQRAAAGEPRQLVVRVHRAHGERAGGGRRRGDELVGGVVAGSDHEQGPVLVGQCVQGERHRVGTVAGHEPAQTQVDDVRPGSRPLHSRDHLCGAPEPLVVEDLAGQQ
jgi:hypothetical protein